MKASSLLAFALVLILGYNARGEISLRLNLTDSNIPVPLCDPCVPNVYCNIMAGTKLSIIISSDAGGYWGGGLFIAGTDRDYGVLSGRDYNDTTLDWQGSRFEKAGAMAVVWDSQEDLKSGFILSTDNDAVAGDWFVIDYLATNIGDCNVGIYDDNYSIDEPLYEVLLHQVRTRDFNNDTIVNFTDLAIFASYWLQTTCSNPDWCGGCDLNTNGDVDPDDVILFSSFWLKNTK
jgi:hypothetical protein